MAMMDLRESIIADIHAERHFAWQTRVRQVEEIYFKALYCLFIATEDELPHVFSGAMPNGLIPIYRKVNKLVLEGRGKWEGSQPKDSLGIMTPVTILHSSGHASYNAMFTAMTYAIHPDSRRRVGRKFIKHLNVYCDRLEHMHKLFKAGRDKQTVLSAIISMHRP